MLHSQSDLSSMLDDLLDRRERLRARLRAAEGNVDHAAILRDAILGTTAETIAIEQQIMKAEA